MSKAKAKRAATNLPVPQSRAEAAQALRLFGDLRRQVEREQTVLNDEIARITAEAAKAIDPVQERMTATLAGLQQWAEANRADLTRGGTKTHDLGTGTIAWRLRPPKVSVRGMEAVIAALQASKPLRRFLRTKVEIDREAMLKEPEAARKVAGVSIASDGEDFIVEPLAADLQAAA